MPPNSFSSSESGRGGVPLHGDSPIANQETMKTDSSSTDEETKLVRASAEFATDLKNPFGGGPEVPQSVAPGVYRRYGGTPQFSPGYSHGNTPAGADPAVNGNSNQALTKYRQSFSSNEDRTPEWLNGDGPNLPVRNTTGFPDGNGVSAPLDSALQMSDTIQRRIKIAIRYVNVTPGCPGEVGMNHGKMLQDIAQLVNATIHQLVEERNQSSRVRKEEHEKFKQALYDSSKSKQERDVAQQDLKLAMEKENYLQKHIDMLKNQLSLASSQVQAVEADSKRFQEHHAKVTEEYKGQDEKHFKQIQALEREIRALRQQNSELVKAAGLPESAKDLDLNDSPALSVPESFKNSKEEELHKSGLKKEDAEMLLEGLKKAASRHQDQSFSSERSLFLPNPEAPVWAPSHDGNEASKKSLVRTTSKIKDLRGVQPRGHIRSMTPASRSVRERKTTDTDADRHLEAAVNVSNDTSSTSRSLVPAQPRNHGTERRATHFQMTTSSPVKWGKTMNAAVAQAASSMPRHKMNWEAEDIQKSINHLYEVTKGYVVSCHKQGPPANSLRTLHIQEPSTWMYLADLVYPSPQDASNHMKWLLSQDCYIPFVIERMCIDYLYKKILSPQVFLGYSTEMDAHLSALQSQISTIAQGNHRNNSRTRQRVIEDHARLVAAITTSPNVKQFRADVIERHSYVLASILSPLRSKSISDEHALKSLRIMVGACWDISTKVWTSGMTLHYLFPECGGKYAFGTMDALNGPQVASSPEQLQYSQVRVSLVVTPTLNLRDDRDDSSLFTYGIQKAEVLVMK